MTGEIHSWARFLDDSELDIIRRTLLRHISDATWCSDEEAATLRLTATELGDEMTARETKNLAETYKHMFRED